MSAELTKTKDLDKINDLEDDIESDSDSDSEVALESDADSEIDSEDEEDDGNGEEEINEKNVSQKLVSKFALDLDEDDNENSDEDQDDDDDERYLQKLDEGMKHNIVTDYYPELKALNSDEVDILTRVVRNEAGLIIDPLHRTLPFITKYERTRILGERAKQLNSGAKPFVEVAADVLDGYLIALAEFEQKKIPFIVKRPLPNGGCEYWKLRDLEIL